MKENSETKLQRRYKAEEIRKKSEEMLDHFVAYVWKYDMGKAELTNEAVGDILDTLLYVQNVLRFDLGIKEEALKFDGKLGI